jgi:DNA-binding MarR family transcriptional regulator
MVKKAERPPRTSVVDLAGELRALVSKLKRRLRAQVGSGDLTPSQVSVLRRLETDGPDTVSGLARAEGIRPQSMGAIIGTLQKAGLVRSTMDPKDRRQAILSLTDTCRDLIREGRAGRQDWLCRSIEAKLSRQEQAELAVALNLLKRLTDR